MQGGGGQAGGPSGGGFGGNGQGGGGLLNSTTPSAALTTALTTNAASFRWVAATVGAENASGYQLASDEPVLAIGGFNGTDPTPTLTQFEGYVSSGAIHYYIPGGTGGASTSSTAISSWVVAHYTAVTIGGTTIYDLTRPLS